MTGHIRLNNKQYMLSPDLPNGITQQTYTPFAAQMGSGKEYDDLQEWSAWVMNNWQAGTNQKDPKAGGFLYAEAETRFPERILLPLRINFSGYLMTYWTPGEGNGTTFDTFTIGTTGDYEKIAGIISFTITEKIYNCWFLADIGNDVEVTWELRETTINGGIIASGTYTPSGDEPRNGMQWHHVFVNGTAGVSGTAGVDYFFIIYPSTAGETFDVLYQQSTSLSSRVYDGTNWHTLTNPNRNHFWFMDVGALGDNAVLGPEITAIKSFDGNIYAGASDETYKYTSFWQSFSTLSDTVTSMEVFGNNLYVGQGNSTNYYFFDTAGARTQASVPGRLFRSWNGYLWRAVENDVYYSGDGSTWTGPLEVGPDGFEIRGMAGLGDKLYISTDEGLWAVLPGDFVMGVVQWPSDSSTNGRGMLEWQGDLYIPLGTGLWRYTQDGQLISIGLDRGEGLPNLRNGKIRSLSASTNWLFAFIETADDKTYSANTEYGSSSVWAWNGEGWHQVAQLPPAALAGTIFYDQSNNYLWIGSGQGVMGRLYLPDKTENPLNLDSQYSPVGWIEFPKMHGGLRELYKDFESVYIDGENITPARTVKVYWQDEDSTDWELLGTVTSNNQELLWSDANTRPNSRWLRLALELTTDNITETPVVEAVRVKFHPMVTDLYRWNVTIQVADNIQMLDGTEDSRTANTIKNDLEDVLESVPPVTFVDPTGSQYTVKAESGAFNYTELYYDQNRNKKWKGVYRLTLRQIRADEVGI